MSWRKHHEIHQLVCKNKLPYLVKTYNVCRWKSCYEKAFHSYFGVWILLCNPYICYYYFLCNIVVVDRIAPLTQLYVYEIYNCFLHIDFHLTNYNKYSNCITHIYLYISFFAAGIDLNIFEKRYNFDWNIIDLKINYLRKRKVTQSINYRMFASKSLNSVFYY